MERNICDAKSLYEDMSFILGHSSTGCKWQSTRTDLVNKVPKLFFATVDSIMGELGIEKDYLYCKRIVCEGLEYNKHFEDILELLRIEE